MATKRTNPPWSVSAVEYDKSLKSFGVNPLVRDVEASKNFAEQVLNASVVYWNEEFAVLRVGETQWMLHADRTYADNPLLGFVEGVEGRGQGVELYLYERDPDEAEAAARARGHVVLAGSLDKPHGARDCYLLDPGGYCWVASHPLAD